MPAAANISKPSNLPLSSTVLASATITRTDVVPSVLFNPLSRVARDLRADLHADHFARRPHSINQVREASSGSAPCIENTIPWRELKKVHCSLPQRLYEKDVKIWEGTDQTNQVSGIRRGEFAIVHRV